MRLLRPLILAALMLAPAGVISAQDKPGVFDHYILALSWNTSWCLAEGDREERAQCDRGAGHAFIVHGLWPQHRRGWPEFCDTDRRDPTRRETAAMADIMGSGGLAWYQWRKHGRCTGLDGRGYLEAIRRAADRIVVPPGFERVDETVSLDPDTVEQAFLRANAGLDENGIVVTCRDGRLREVRVCLDKSLSPISCTDQAGRACRRDRVEIPPVR